MEKSEKMVNQKKASIIIQHDPTHFTKLPVYPKCLE